MAKLTDSEFPSLDPQENLADELIVEDDGSEALEYVQQLISRMKTSPGPQTAQSAPKKPGKSQAAVRQSIQSKSVSPEQANPKSESPINAPLAIEARNPPEPSSQVDQALQTFAPQTHNGDTSEEDSDNSSSGGSGLSTAAWLARLAKPTKTEPILEVPDEEQRIVEKPKRKKPKVVDSRADIDRLREAANLTSRHALKTFDSKQTIRRAYGCLFFTLFFTSNALISRVISDSFNRFANVIVFGSLLFAIAGTVIFFMLVKQISLAADGRTGQTLVKQPFAADPVTETANH